MNQNVLNRNPAPAFSKIEADNARKRFGEIIAAYRSAKILFVAAKLDCFTRLGSSAKEIDDIASCLAADRRAAGILMDALVSLGFLSKKNGRYSNAEISSRFLVRTSPEYLGDNLVLQDSFWSIWDTLEDVVRTGEPDRSLKQRIVGQEDFVRKYIEGIHAISRGPAAEIADRFELSGARDLLDVGGGSGVYSMAFLDKNPGLRAVILDLPDTLKCTERFLSDYGNEDRISLRPGDYREPAQAPESFDVILLSHVSHNEDELVNRNWCRESFKTLRPGGRLIIHDFMTDSNGTHPVFSALFSAHMMLLSKKGRVYNRNQYEQWLGEAGFSGLSTAIIGPNSGNPTRVIVGHK